MVAIAITMLLLLQLMAAPRTAMAARTLHVEDMNTSPVLRLNTIASEFAKPLRAPFCKDTCIFTSCSESFCRCRWPDCVKRDDLLDDSS